MRTLVAALGAAAVLCGGAAGAAAQKFGDVASKAEKIGDENDLAALFWAATVDCTKAEDDLYRRQCEGVRDARAEAGAGRLFVMDVDSAFEAADWDATESGIPFVVRGCLACERPLDLGERRFVITKGAVSVAGGALLGPEIHKSVKVFKDKAQADRWKQIVAPRVRTQILFKVPAKPDGWSHDGAKGFALELVGFRSWDPCDGVMIASNPVAENEKADKAACKGGLVTSVEEDKPKPPPEPEKPKEPELPETLSTYHLKQAIQSQAVPAVNSCFATYGVPGKADVIINISNDGTVNGVELDGDFVETPTGDCIVAAVKRVTFPKFKRKSMSFPYPFMLR
jgi:hypothetical protein